MFKIRLIGGHIELGNPKYLQTNNISLVYIWFIVVRNKLLTPESKQKEVIKYSIKEAQKKEEKGGKLFIIIRF